VGRGIHQKTIDRRMAILAIVNERHPVSVRGIAYPLFTPYGVIDSMSKANTDTVSKDTVALREAGLIPWDWIVDDGRPRRKVSTWSDPAAFIQSALSQYRQDFWTHQSTEVWVWSEKATVYGVLRPVLDQYAVPFQAHKGFSSATAVHDAAEQSLRSDAEDVVILYVGDYDPSGLYMSEMDLPARLDAYGGAVTIERVALLPEDGPDFGLVSFSVTDKRSDTRYRWWMEHGYGTRCWEIDVMNPVDLRARVEQEILAYIEPVAWNRCVDTEAAERASMQQFFTRQTSPKHG
jgi:hypothetical protein